MYCILHLLLQHSPWGVSGEKRLTKTLALIVDLTGNGAGFFPWKGSEIFSAAQEWFWCTFSLGLPIIAGNM